MARMEFETGNFSDIAAAGSAEIWFELGLIYASGRDGEQDMVAAHKWFNLAASRGLEAARTRREEIAREMTREQISKAQSAARDWISKN